MAIKKILVPFDGGESGLCMLAAALAVARRFSSHIEALLVRANPEDALRHLNVGLPGAGVADDIVEAATHAADQAAREVQTVFRDFCSRRKLSIAEVPGNGTPSASFREEIGRPSLAIARRARLADIVVHGRPDGGRILADTLEDALMQSGRPILIVPTDQEWKDIGSNIAIGWDGSAEAARAVAGALPFLAKKSKATIITVHGTGNGEALRTYLAWHGINAAITEASAKNLSTGEVLLKEAHSVGANLMVLGGYGHSRARELALGGVTRHMLRAGDLPLLMAH